MFKCTIYVLIHVNSHFAVCMCVCVCVCVRACVYVCVRACVFVLVIVAIGILKIDYESCEASNKYPERFMYMYEYLTQK